MSNEKLVDYLRAEANRHCAAHLMRQAADLIDHHVRTTSEVMAERDKLEAEVERLRSRAQPPDQGTTQHCADAAEMAMAKFKRQKGENDRLRRDRREAAFGDVAARLLSVAKAEATQWQEAAGQSYTRACDAEAREERLREALEGLLAHAERHECCHENTERGGVMWTICCGCGRRWADDEGGMPEYVEPAAITAAHKALEGDQ